MSKITIDREKLKLVLGALKCCYDVDSYPADGSTIQDEAIILIEEALAQPAQERNFCSRCGKRTNDIHTCTPPQEGT